ncbi:PREDICTED: uncharacterized protein LOC107341595 [Acropora digitifera]|uniref:uncharacterized protein LOC107341595 n=1 Tax=Acropora digitifera TaxID=70779 RepID=UPI000779F48E|nr:PREDICTED: uncharacterized protein LOC107341595 [Acropora digitifera]
MKTFASILVLVASVDCLAVTAARSSVLWPQGRYGLPMPRSGCPSSTHFAWMSGFLYQDLENDQGKTRASPNAHFRGSVTSDVEQYFCIKNSSTLPGNADPHRTTWPAGQYCIYQKGSTCPVGMQSGFVSWDDENGINGKNKNNHSGSLPTGVYNQDTTIYYCCQTQGSYDKPILLPTDKSFYLMALENHCQHVLNTVHTMEHIYFDTENENNHDQLTRPVPYGAGWSTLRAIHYCYYQGVNPTTAKTSSTNNGESSSSSSSSSSPSSSAPTTATITTPTSGFGVTGSSRNPFPTNSLAANHSNATVVSFTDLRHKAFDYAFTSGHYSINFVNTTLYCSGRKRAATDQDRLQVEFTSPENKVIGMTNICVAEVCQESELDEEYYSVITKIEKLNVLYGRGDSINRPGSPAINDTNNPLYIRSNGSIIESNNPLYASCAANSPDQQMDNLLYTTSHDTVGAPSDDWMYESVCERLKGAIDDEDNLVYEKMV